MKQSMVGSEKQNQIGTAFAMGKNTSYKVGMIEKQLFHDVTGCRGKPRTVEGRVIALTNKFGNLAGGLQEADNSTFLKSGQMP
jgi:hypothetical protein